MKSLKHVAVDAVAGAVAVVAMDPPGSLPLLVAGAVFMSILVGLDHFVIARIQRGDWANLRLAVTNPRVGPLDQERMFEELDTEFGRRRLLGHHLVGGVAVGALVFSGLGSFAAFFTVVLYVYVACDFLRDFGVT